MRKLMVALLLSMCLLLPQAVFALEGGGISENLYDFQVLIDGKMYQFPIPFAELEAEGWKFDEEGMEAELLAGSSYTMLHLVQRDMDSSAQMRAEIVNLAVDAKPMRECFVGSLNIAESFGKERQILLGLSKGIELMKSTYNEVHAAYGIPAGRDESAGMVFLQYKVGEYQKYDFRFTDEDVLDTVVITCYQQAGTSAQGAVSGGEAGEMPDYLANYVVPTELGTDVEAGIFEFEGDLYRLLAPVSAFEKNGWTASAAKQETVPSGHGIMRAVTLERDGKSVQLNVINVSTTAQAPMQCGFSGFYGADSKYEWPEGRFSFVLPGNISVGASKEDIRKAYGDKVSLFLEMSDYNVYKYDMPKGMWLEFRVDNATEKLIALRYEISI